MFRNLKREIVSTKGTLSNKILEVDNYLEFSINNLLKPNLYIIKDSLKSIKQRIKYK